MQSAPTTPVPTPAAAAPRLHPLVAGAAVAVIAVSTLAGVAIVNSQVSARHTPEGQMLAAATETPAQSAQPQAAEPAVPARQSAEPAAQPAQPKKPQTAPRKQPVAATEPQNSAANPPAPVAQVPAPSAGYPSAPVAAPPPVCMDCGVVTAVREVKTAGQGTGVGAVAGGVLGGVLGNQVGKGNGRDAARILGAIGGAVAGHQVEKQARATVRYEVDVRMDDGSLRTVSQDAAPSLRAGDAVRVDGSRLLHADGRPIALRAKPQPAFNEGGA